MEKSIPAYISELALLNSYFPLVMVQENNGINADDSEHQVAAWGGSINKTVPALQGW